MIKTDTHRISASKKRVFLGPSMVACKRNQFTPITRNKAICEQLIIYSRVMELSAARAFHNGYWWPLYTTEWYAPRVSQPMFDPYSLTHIIHGFLMQLMLVNFAGFWEGGLAIATGVEMTWESFENSDFIMERFRENSGTSGEYKGDSIQNVFGDILSMVFGYSLATLFHSAGIWWLTILSIIASEV